MSKTILVTGSSSGLGQAVALHFADKGWNVVASMRNTNKGEVFSGRDNVEVVALDVTKPETMQPAIDRAVDRFGSIDVLFNNVGYGSLMLFEEISDESYRNMFETNFFGHLNVMRAVLPVMRRQQSGYIINVTSLTGLFGIPMQTGYCASKFAMTGFTEAAKWELRSQGIETTVFEVGGMKTEFPDHMKNGREHANSDYDNYMERMVPAIEAATEKFMASASSVGDVAAEVYKLVHKKRKPFRYHPTRDGKIMALLMRVFPDNWFRKVSTMGLEA